MAPTDNAPVDSATPLAAVQLPPGSTSDEGDTAGTGTNDSAQAEPVPGSPPNGHTPDDPGDPHAADVVTALSEASVPPPDARQVTVELLEGEKTLLLRESSITNFFEEISYPASLSSSSCAHVKHMEPSPTKETQTPGYLIFHRREDLSEAVLDVLDEIVEFMCDNSRTYWTALYWVTCYEGPAGSLMLPFYNRRRKLEEFVSKRTVTLINKSLRGGIPKTLLFEPVVRTSPAKTGPWILEDTTAAAHHSLKEHLECR
ncbi:hypothetical protein PC119_g1681 [Phytophthora cactorum]|nr:hypothetical protein PC119_g1681 [Phytophthora cactorum]